MNKKELLLALLKEAVGKCYLHDFSLIERGMEQASVARIFFYMQEALKYDNRFTSLSRYSLDSEYGKKGLYKKTTLRFENGTYPDVILHNRLDKPCQDNVMIVEFKTHLSKANTIPDAVAKLEDFTNPKVEDPYNYFLGVLATLNLTSADYRYYQFGQERQEEDLHNE